MDRENLLMLDKNSDPTFTQVFQAMLERIPPERMSYGAKLVYSKFYSLYHYYKKLDDKNLVRENQTLLAKACGMTARQLQPLIKENIDLGLIEDLTPDLRNRPHCFIVNDWTKRVDLLIHKSVSEIRKEMQQKNLKYSEINLYIESKEADSTIPNGIANTQDEPKKEFYYTIPYSGYTIPYSESTDPYSGYTIPYMSKIEVDPNQIQLDIKEPEIEVITNQHQQIPLNEDDKKISHKVEVSSLVPLSESVKPLISSSQLANEARRFTMSDVQDINAFRLWDISSPVRQMYPNDLSERIKHYINEAA